MDKIIAVDLGTAFLQSAEKNEKGEIEFKTVRNAFVELENRHGIDDVEAILKQNKWQYVTDGKHYYVTGEDSYAVSRIFPSIQLRRPMQDGVLNKDEDKKMLIMASMIENLVGKAISSDSLICFCVSSEAVDGASDSVFHKNRVDSMFKRLGWKTKIIEEGMAIILSEKPILITRDGEKIPYSGLAISLGAGRANAVLAYRGLQILGMSCGKAGDEIDKKVSEQTGISISQVSYIKENKLDFGNIDFEDDVIFALDCYYSNILEYIFRNFSKKFKKIKSQFEGKIPIIFAGGTSNPPGFVEKAKKIINTLDLPFEIGNIKVSKNPLNSVVKGLLIQAIISQKKIIKDDIEKDLE